ncbi:hypothetical protein PROFUN_16678 [Planoprotostelium fungivorum]|uniref:Uncharacterized protein n=1 Tax=Planoprotostelium fungivorum TaxID=1890364 RepID=A0A2P6MPP2_9EUKA|nr:hypothetical protein PROFUN_16678 [Planoprotostelium fungivorum]
MELTQQYNLETSGNYIHNPNNFQVRCQISDMMYYTNSGQGARKEYVKACHIIASSRKALLPLLGFEGDLDVLVNNWRNGIMMLSSIETMLESHDLCLGHNPFDGTWVCLIPNHDLHGIIVTPPGHLPSVSAGDLHKKVIATMNGITPGPYCRAMGCFAAATYHKAEDNDLHQDYFTASANSSNVYRGFVSEYVKGIRADPLYGQNAPAQIVSAQNAPAQIVPPLGAYQCNSNDISHHIPPDVATTNLNTKCKPIPNKSHNSMQVVVETRQSIYFSGISVYLALSSKKVVQRSIRWAQIERVLDGDTMDLPMISQPGLRGYSRGDVNGRS